MIDFYENLIISEIYDILRDISIMISNVKLIQLEEAGADNQMVETYSCLLHI